MCINVISSSGRFALPPLFGELEQRGDLTHPVKNPSPCHVEDLGGGVLAVLLRKQSNLQLEINMMREAGKGVPQPNYGSQLGNLLLP